MKHGKAILVAVLGGIAALVGVVGLQGSRPGAVESSGELSSRGAEQAATQPMVSTRPGWPAPVRFQVPPAPTMPVDKVLGVVGAREGDAVDQGFFFQ